MAKNTNTGVAAALDALQAAAQETAKIDQSGATDPTKALDMSDEGKPKAKPLIPVKLNRDYWAHDDVKDQWPKSPENGEPVTNRIPAGTVINLPGKEARRLMDGGIGVRADPLPDEA